MLFSELPKLIKTQIELLKEETKYAHEYEVRFGKFETNVTTGKMFFNTNITKHNTEMIEKALRTRFWTNITKQTVTDYSVNGIRIRVDENNKIMQAIRKENIEKTDIVVFNHPLDLRLNLAIERKVDFDTPFDQIASSKRTKHKLIFERTLFNMELTKTHYHNEDVFQEELEVKNIKINSAAESHLAEDITDEIIFVLSTVSPLDTNTSKLTII